MATTLNNPTQVGSKAWSYTWSGTAPFNVYSVTGGRYLLQGTDDTDIILNNDDDEEPPTLIVTDSTETDTPDAVKYNRKPILQWRGHKTADYYIVERYNGSTWDETDRVYEDGTGYYTWSDTPRSYYDDAGTLRYRVTVVDLEANTAEIVNIDYFVFGTPDYPSISMSYSSGTGDVTVASR